MKEKLIDGDADALSLVPQRNEAFRSAVYESKRLLYLMLQDKERFTSEVHEAFEGREALLARQLETILKAAETLVDKSEIDAAASLLDYFSNTELIAGLDLVQALSAGIDARIKALGIKQCKDQVEMYEQIW